MRTSHEAIYWSLFVQSRGALKRELVTYLRTRRVLTGDTCLKRPSEGAGKNLITPEAMTSEMRGTNENTNGLAFDALLQSQRVPNSRQVLRGRFYRAPVR